MTTHQTTPPLSLTRSPGVIALVALTLGLGAAACDTALDVGSADSKLAAQRSGGVDPQGNDLCELNDWYGDDECDRFCVDPDPDCPVSSCEPVACEIACENGFAKGADGCEICQCAPGPGPSCPSLSACTIDCQNGFSTDEKGCEICQCAPAPTGPILDACPASTSDSFQLEDATLDGDLLRLRVGYSGGCEKHVFTFCWDGSFRESFPVQTTLGIHHESNDDACEAFLSEDITVDLGQLKRAYQEGYQTTSGTIILGLGKAGQSVSYEF